MKFFGVYQASRGPIPMKIGGNQAGAFPDLPIQPRNLDFEEENRICSPRMFQLFRRKYLNPIIC